MEQPVDEGGGHAGGGRPWRHSRSGYEWHAGRLAAGWRGGHPDRIDGETEAYSETVALAEGGTYAFVDVPAVPGRIYGATVSFGGVLYFSDGADLAGEAEPLELPVTVYDTTTDGSGLQVERLHVLFDFAVPDQVQVLELWVLERLRPDRSGRCTAWRGRGLAARRRHRAGL